MRRRFRWGAGARGRRRAAPIRTQLARASCSSTSAAAQLPHGEGRPGAGGRRPAENPVRHPSTRRTSPPTRRPGSASWTEADFVRPCANGRGPTARRSTRPFPTPPTPGSPTRTSRRSRPISARPAGAQAVAAARALVPLQHALGPQRLAGLFQPGRFQPDPSHDAVLEPGGLPGRGAGALPGVPHAARLRWARCSATAPSPGRPNPSGKGKVPEHHQRSRTPASASGARTTSSPR